MKAVIFDLDGVIIDSEPVYYAVDKTLLREWGHEVADEFLDRYVGATDAAMWQELKDLFHLDLTLAEILKKKKEYNRIFLDRADLQPIDGIRELLADLRQSGRIIGLASSSPKSFIECMLTKLDLRGYFQVLVSGDEVACSKPAPDIFLLAAHKLGVLPADCLVVEDSQAGVRAAKSAGMSCVGYQNPHSGHQDLSAADRLVSSLYDISAV